MKKERISLTVDVEQLRMLSDIREKFGASVSWSIGKAIKEYLEKNFS